MIDDDFVVDTPKKVTIYAGPSSFASSGHPYDVGIWKCNEAWIYGVAPERVRIDEAATGAYHVSTLMSRTDVPATAGAVGVVGHG